MAATMMNGCHTMRYLGGGCGAIDVVKKVVKWATYWDRVGLDGYVDEHDDG